MYNMEILAPDLSTIPEGWIYKWYAQHNDKRSQIISQPFDGRTIRIHSFMNKDVTPSLFIYLRSDGHYHWKDHSSGISGDASYFAQWLLSKNWHVAVEDIKKKYEKFLESGEQLDEIPIEDIEIVNITYEEKKRNINIKDMDFWKKWKIPVHLLLRYKVEPLISYSILKNNTTVGNFNNFENVYGFYSNAQGLYQIYQPTKKEAKYINTKKDYLIGSDQLCFNKDVCIIASGLKDTLALKAIELNIEVVAPKSENTIIGYDKIEMLRTKFKHIITIFDNDDAGVKAMNLYKKIYNIPFVHLHLHKDLADNNEKEDIEFLKKHYTLCINKLIN